jgi:peptide/nickel transport system ATP-binding protein
MPLLDVQNLSLFVAGAPLLQDVSLHVGRGETLCLVGESGSGKTLTALAVMGLLPETIEARADKLVFDKNNLQRLSSRQHRRLRGARMAMIFQEPLSALNPVMKVGDQVAEVFQVHTRLSRRQRFDKVVEMFTKVQLPQPEALYHRYPHQLSGGQRQRVMIAMALALQPDLLIADEPTTALDVTVQREILKLIDDLKQEFKASVLFITHDFGVVKQVADRVAVLEKGRLVEEGATQQILTRPQQAYTQKLVAAMPVLETSPKPAPGTNVLLEVQGLSKVYTSGGGLFTPARKVQALQDVSFTLARGQTIGVVGESGSGKSTLAKCILQLERPDAGSVRLNGREMTRLGRRALRRAWRDVQMVFQDPFASLNPRRRIGDSIGEGLAAHGTPRRACVAQVATLLEAVGLEPTAAQRYPHQFSGGQRQRIGLARALALHPELVIADEAVASLDVSVQRQVLKLMDELKQSFGLSYLFISHDLRVVSQIADWVLVMKDGCVVEQGPTHQVFLHPREAYTQRLLSALPG